MDDQWTPTRVSVAGWALYDLANTVFVLGVVGLYFPRWVVIEEGWPDASIGVATAAAMAVVVLTAPWIGARSDHRGRVRYLRITTLAAVTATAMLARVPVLPSLALFALAQMSFQLGTVVYDALLPDVSTAANRGRVSGLGIAAGYVGSFIAVGTGILLIDRVGFAGVFGAMALLFLVFATPAFFMVRERPRSPVEGGPPGAREALGQLIRSWRRARRFPGVTRFLVGRFLYTDAINTLIAFLVIFAEEEVGLSRRQVDFLLPTAITAAIVGAATAGRIVDRIGPRPALHAMVYTWMLAFGLGITAVVADLDVLAWPLAVVGGVGLGGITTADRVYMARLSPAEHLGEFYGLYATVGRFATIVGPLVWAFVVDVADLGRTAAVGALLLFVVASRIVLQGVPRLQSQDLRSRP